MHSKSVFIALDDGITASDIRKVLMMAGISRLKVFSTCENMLREVINSSPPDLIIADTEVRDRNNLLNSIDQIRAKFNIPVIFLLRDRRLSELTLPDDSGCDFISKPLADNKLLKSLEKFLNAPTSTSEAPF